MDLLFSKRCEMISKPCKIASGNVSPRNVIKLQWCGLITHVKASKRASLFIMFYSLSARCDIWHRPHGAQPASLIQPNASLYIRAGKDERDIWTFCFFPLRQVSCILLNKPAGGARASHQEEVTSAKYLHTSSQEVPCSRSRTHFQIIQFNLCTLWT